MECRACSELMTALLDGELSASEAEALRSHIASCEECGAEFESLSYSWRMVESQASADWPAPPAWALIESRISGTSKGFFDWRWLTVPRWATAVAALLLLAVSLPFFYSSTGDNASIRRMLASYVAERDQQESLHEAIIETEPHGWVSYNPFADRDRLERGNPFSSE